MEKINPKYSWNQVLLLVVISVPYFEGVSIQFLGDQTDVFQSVQKWFYPCIRSLQNSSVINYELEFVKMQFLVKSISPWQQ